MGSWAEVAGAALTAPPLPSDQPKCVRHEMPSRALAGGRGRDPSAGAGGPVGVASAAGKTPLWGEEVGELEARATPPRGEESCPRSWPIACTPTPGPSSPRTSLPGTLEGPQGPTDSEAARDPSTE